MGVRDDNLAVGLGGEVARGIVVQPSGKVVVAATIEHAARWTRATATSPWRASTPTARATPPSAPTAW
jgi:hypothetical protein